MNKKTCIRSVCSKRIIREEEIGYHVTPEITSNKKFILFPFALLLVHFLCCYIVLYQAKPTQQNKLWTNYEVSASMPPKKLQYFLINVLTVALTIDQILLSERLPCFQVVFLDWLSRLQTFYLYFLNLFLGLSLQFLHCTSL